MAGAVDLGRLVHLLADALQAGEVDQDADGANPGEAPEEERGQDEFRLGEPADGWIRIARVTEGTSLKTLKTIRIETVLKEPQWMSSPEARLKLAIPMNCLLSPPCQSKKLL